MGARQVGKTTLAQQLIEQIEMPGMYESADAVPAGNDAWLEQIWGIARLKAGTSGSDKFLLIIDEIQKIARWSEMVKKLWDEDSRNNSPVRVLLLGSSRLLLQQGMTESLAGRFEATYLPHWSLSEMQNTFGWDAETYAWFGGYPGSAGLISDEARWKKYIRDSLIETSISKDILMLTRIDKPALLKNLFEMGCTYSGQVLSYTKMQGQLQDAGNTTTLSHYLTLLETAGLLSGLEKYSGSEVRRRSSSPKLQVHNNALLSSQSSLDFDTARADHSAWGRVVESAIGSWLVNQAPKRNMSVFWWRERNDEVDFVLEHRSRTVAIEVKSSYDTNRKGLTEFVKRYNPDRSYLIDNKSLTWQEFLTIDPLELF
ncbi:MAG: ATP-binding protein [Bacteroidales bacterium]|nr:ATP-binding protein [Bacteroidales bacterium]